MIVAGLAGIGLAVAAAIGPAAAQELSDRYEPLGTITGRLNGAEVTFHATYDREYDRSGLQVISVFGQPGFAIIAGQLTEEGGIARPFLSLSIGPVAPDAPEYEIAEARLTDDAGRKRPLRATAADGTARIDALTIGDDGAVSFGLSLDLVRMERDGRDFAPIPGAPGMKFEGRFTGRARPDDVIQLN